MRVLAESCLATEEVDEYGAGKRLVVESSDSVVPTVEVGMPMAADGCHWEAEPVVVQHSAALMEEARKMEKVGHRRWEEHAALEEGGLDVLPAKEKVLEAVQHCWGALRQWTNRTVVVHLQRHWPSTRRPSQPCRRQEEGGAPPRTHPQQKAQTDRPCSATSLPSSLQTGSTSRAQRTSAKWAGRCSSLAPPAIEERQCWSGRSGHARGPATSA